MKLIRQILESQLIGFFKCVEVIEIFGLSKNNNERPFNIFTIAIAQELSLDLSDGIFLTKNPISIKKDKHIRFCIKKSILSIDNFIKKLENLDTNNQWEDNKGKCLTYGELRTIPHVFTPYLEYGNNEFLGLLKNNFFDGSHIFEWFDESKEYVKSLLDNHYALEELSEELQKILPIKIGSHSDRLGNFILQIPCSTVTFSIIRKDKNSSSLISNLAINPEIREPVNLTGIFWRENYENIIDFCQMPLKIGENIIPFKQINGMNNFIIKDITSGIICSGGKTMPMIESINYRANIKEYQKRIFKLPSGHERRVEIFYQELDYQKGDKKDYRDWVNKRLLQREKMELAKNFKLMQFKKGMREEALEIIRKLIIKHGRNGVYLWDPYLSADDLLETVFFTPYANVPIRALTSLKDPNLLNSNIIIKNYKEKLEQSIIESSQLNLIFINSDRSDGNFHDRFLIFPQRIDNPAKVWSLGTSVNSLGKSHHIVQEVADGQIIEDFFEEMWQKSIANKDNIIWQI